MAEEDRVECKICGEKFKRINWAHLKKHNLTTEEYKKQFPNAKIFSDETKERMSESLTGRFLGKNNPRYNRVEKKCEVCGNTFLIVPSAWDSRKTCSKECESIYRKNNYSGKNHPSWNGGKVSVECDYCGSEFKVVPARKDEARFCSEECYGMWERGKNNPYWRGGHGRYYGMNWKEQRRKSRERDNHICQVCGVTEDGMAHHVHHITPFRIFGLGRYKEANDLSNLITLCPNCHKKADIGEISRGELKEAVL